MLAILIAIPLLTFIVWEVFLFYRRRSTLPPGPFAVPLFGNFINEITPPLFHVGLKRLSAKFGNIFTVHMPYPVVNITDFETIRDVFKSNDATGRMHNVLLETTRLCENGGIVNSDGPEWQEQRRFAISTLRDFGMGKNLMEEKVRLSARNMVEFIGKQEDLSNTDLRWSIQVFVANIINEFLFGFQYPFDDCETLMNFVLGLNKAIEGISRSLLMPIIFMLPWARHIPFVRYFWRQHQQRFQKMINYVSVQAKAIKFDPNEEPTCYVQAFQLNNKDKRFEQLLSCCSELFLAGQETTTTTLRWGMLLLAKHQEVQDKLREEIHSKIDRDEIASMTDKMKMPYTAAVINEVQRVANIVAFNPVLMHRVTVDTTIGGYHIPANTLINGDFHQMMKSDPLFVDPTRFWPERYLAEDGVTLRKELVERTIPFSIGKRQCAGEGLARTELFIGLVSLIQNFRISPLPGKEIDLEPIYANIHFPKPQNFRLEKI
ncbi:hypothetical protein PRIPAC_75741 [Pristionchus pacificus]|uniref:Cytochrome P450 n=1 Tax=Pristionchus pacificus TaxID=54126 RepID=A0A2A6B535_PRIPA|nr:hypothetical protein PRIPAC_75741 [Pristionchus pacificus]|eukprot:PDM60982.1 cytochrome P450 [Pristionchus pacificus]